MRHRRTKEEIAAITVQEKRRQEAEAIARDPLAARDRIAAALAVSVLGTCATGSHQPSLHPELSNCEAWQPVAEHHSPYAEGWNAARAEIHRKLKGE